MTSFGLIWVPARSPELRRLGGQEGGSSPSWRRGSSEEPGTLLAGRRCADQGPRSKSARSARAYRAPALLAYYSEATSVRAARGLPNIRRFIWLVVVAQLKRANRELFVDSAAKAKPTVLSTKPPELFPMRLRSV